MSSASKRIKFNDFLSPPLLNAQVDDEPEHSTVDGPEHLKFEQLPELLQGLVKREEVDAYEAKQRAMQKEIDTHLQKRAASDILYWARPPAPILVGRLLQIVSIDHADESMIAKLEPDVTITLGYGWLEEQAKNGRPAKVSPHFFKEPVDYVKAIKPFLYSVQDNKDYPLLYKFQLHQNKL